MARDYATTPMTIWDDDTFLDLTPAEQHLHFVLQAHPGLGYAGVTDWRPARIAALASGWTASDVEAAAKGLERAGLLVVDEATEEVFLVRFLFDDGLMKQANMAVAMLRAYRLVASRTLRGVIVWVLRRLHMERPNLAGWKGEGVLELLDKPSIDPSIHPSIHPSSDPSVDPPVDPSDTGDGTLPMTHPMRGATQQAPNNPNTQPSTSGARSDADPASPPSDDASQQAAPPDGKPKAKRGTRLPADWQPTRELVEQMRGECPGVDLKAEHLKFVDHWLSKSGSNATKLDWPRTWCNWMRTARDRMPRRDEPTRGQTMWDREAGQ
jgi:hypothetical protein